MKSPDSLRQARFYPSSKAVALLLSVTVVSGCGNYGKPSIVAGVPAQVDYKEKQAEYDPSNPPLWPEHYYFGLEQCPADIAKAKSGQPVDHPSFNPATHEHDPQCFVQRVEVPLNVYNQYQEGATIIFQGAVGQAIGRVG